MSLLSLPLFQKQVPAALALGAACLSAYITYALTRPVNAPKAFVLVIRLKFKPGGLERFLELWAPLAIHCRLHEPYTMTYEAAYSTDEENTILIYERYPTKADLVEPHQQSELFKKLQTPEVGALVAEKRVEEYLETNIGYPWK